MLILSLTMFYKYRKKDLLWVRHDFRLLPEESDRFKEACYAIDIAEKTISSSEEAADAEGISRKQNGEISIRSYRGKELVDTINSAENVLNDKKKLYKNIRKRPVNRWKAARKHFSIAIASCCSLLPWGALPIAIFFDEKLIRNILVQETSVNRFVTYIEDLAIYVTGYSLAVWVIVWLICLIIFRYKNRKPPMLNLDNIDNYTIKHF